MSKIPPSDDPPSEIEVSLEDNANLELRTVDIDSEGLSIEFSASGVIHNLDSDMMDELQGKDLRPVAVRFRLLQSDE